MSIPAIGINNYPTGQTKQQMGFKSIPQKLFSKEFSKKVMESFNRIMNAKKVKLPENKILAELVKLREKTLQAVGRNKKGVIFIPAKTTIKSLGVLSGIPTKAPVKQVKPRPELRKIFDRFNGLPKNEWDKSISTPPSFVQDFLRNQGFR